MLVPAIAMNTVGCTLCEGAALAWTVQQTTLHLFGFLVHVPYPLIPVIAFLDLWVKALLLCSLSEVLPQCFVNQHAKLHSTQNGMFDDIYYTQTVCLA